MGLAAIVKYHSLVMLPETLIIFIILAWRNRWGWRRLLSRLGWISFAFILVAGWWFAFLLIQFNQIAELGLVRGIMAPLGDPIVTEGVYRFFDFRAGGGTKAEFTWSDWAVLTFKTFWIAYGSLRVLATPAVYRLLAWLSFLALLGLGGQIVRWSRSLMVGWSSGLDAPTTRPPDHPTTRLPIYFVLALHLLFYLAVVMVRYLSRNLPETAQGRHLYPAITAVAFFFTVGLAGLLQYAYALLLSSDRLVARWSRRLVVCWSGGLDDPTTRLSDDLTTRRPDFILLVGLSGFLIGLSLITPARFILPVYEPLPMVRIERGSASARGYESLISWPAGSETPGSAGGYIADGLRFAGFSLDRTAVEIGQAATLSLYWQVETAPERPYLMQVCLQDSAGETVTCHQGYPVEGRYPTRAWEAGYIIRDEIHLPLPACLSPGYYDLTLSVLPLRLDTTLTMVDQTSPAAGPISLGRISLRPGQQPERDGFEVWVRGERYEGGTIALAQVRQGLTVIRYAQMENPARPRKPLSLRLQPVVSDSAPTPNWLPLAVPPALSTVHPGSTSGLGSPSGLVYPCSPGLAAITHNFVVEPALSPGTYRFVTEDGRRTTDDGRRTTTVGKPAPLASQRVAENGPEVALVIRHRNFRLPTPLASQRLANEIEARVGDSLTLLGLEAPAALETPATYAGDFSPRFPGDRLSLTFHWQARRMMNRAYVGSVHLLDQAMTSHGQADHILGGAYRNILWLPGEIVSDSYQLVLTDPLPAGLYRVQFRVYDYLAEGGIFNFLPVVAPGNPEPIDHLDLGSLRVLDPARLRPPDYPRLVELGKQIQLLGYDLAEADSEAPLAQECQSCTLALEAPAATSPQPAWHLALHWQALDRPDRDYTVFTQLIGPDGQVWGQQDNQPQGGRYPTTAWALQDRVVDRYTLSLREGAPPGQYQLLAGMYDLPTGQRLAAIGAAGNRLPNDAIVLTTLTIGSNDE